MRVVLDGQVTGADGISRCTRHLAAALQRLGAEQGLELHVEPPTGVPRYSLAEGSHLLEAARRHRADLLHLLDYRVPISTAPLPLVVTVHDLLRLRHPEHCYSDDAFLARFGSDGMSRLREATSALRRRTSWPPGATRSPVSWHEEFYGRMTAHAAATATAVLTPTRTVAAHLPEAVGHSVPATAVPWGTDHLSGVGRKPSPRVDGLRVGGYVLYVGQARSHKGLPILMEAFRRSAAQRQGLKLVLAGRDFAPGSSAIDGLDEHAVPVGEVDDLSLARLYAGAAAVAHLAEHEGFGFPPLEALSFGARVLAADIPVLRETLGCHAHFTDPGDPAAAATALDHLLDSDDSLDTRRVRAMWASRFRWDTCARQVVDCYRKALA